VGVNDNKDRQFSNHTDRVPSLLPINYSIGNNDMLRIVPNVPCKLE
ncbi:MAG: hypothetical protein QOC72_3100, partial [Methylobacteriaceae bacterium]|nr:hypothetical protein [Methylobacteriaceae bacterium]